MASQQKLSSILFLLIIFISAGVKAQTQVSNTNKDYHHMSELDEAPAFPGGIQEFYNFIGANYQTPKVQGLAGKVYVTFIIEKDGSVVDIRVLRDIGYGTGREAIRVLQNCPKWTPGKYKGETVRVLYSLPINIQATQKFEEKTYPAAEVFEKPTYPGGMQLFYRFVNKFFKLPQTPPDVLLKGQIYVTFVVEKDGSLTHAKVLRDLGYGTGEEALRMLRLSQKWIPGKLKDGTAVKTAYSLPITIQSAN
ncbi:energy transducer TonB [Flavobacterium limi]|nr:energy transducer TonB [Flavobacterium limi]